MATASIYLSSADSPDCDPCVRANKEKEAIWYCEDCKVNLCDTCHDGHCRLGLTKDHVTHMLVQTSSRRPGDGSSKGIISKLQRLLPGRKQSRDGQKHDSKPLHYDQVSGRKDTKEGTKTINKWTGKDQASGKLVPDVKQTSLDDVSGTSQSSPSVPSVSSKPKFSSATIMNKFDASLENEDWPGGIRGILIMGHLILLADYQHNKIKAFSKREFHFIFQTRVYCAYDLIDINADTIAVTSGVENFFTLFTLKNEVLTEIRKVKTSDWCWGICHHDSLIFVVIRNNRFNVARVDVFTLEGKLNKRIEPVSMGQNVFQNPDYITINHQTRILYVGDWGTSKVVGLTLSGKVIFKQIPRKCDSVAGVAVDDQGQLYVCGGISNNVIRVSPDGMTSGVLVTKDIRQPQCLCVHGNELILGCRDTNIMRIYKLS